MKNKDMITTERTEIFQRMQKAVTENDHDAYNASVNDLMEQIASGIRAEFSETQAAADRSILASRGIRQLTNEETGYFQRLGDAMRSENPRQALSELTVVMPKTTIDAVFEDLEQEHPLLSEIDFQNTSGLVEILMNTHEKQLGAWGELTAEITKELSSGFKKVSLTLTKYSAFLPVAKSMLDLGPAYLETYVRKVLSEAIYCGLEQAIITGDGKDCPIGMNRQVGEGVSVTGGKYPEKTPIKVTSFDPAAYGSLLAQIAQDPDGHQRKFDHALMIVSPSDYFSKVFPATTIRAADGTYTKDILPYPTKIIPSLEMPEGKMLLGRGKSYFMAVGSGKDPKITYDDSTRFLEDERVYLTKVYAHGEPKDNNAFLYCDISKLQPAVQTVKFVEETADEASVQTAAAAEKKAAK